MVWTLATSACAQSRDSLALSGGVTAPPGAALAFTSDDPLIVQARQLYAAGRFADAQALVQEADLAPPARQAGEELVEIIRRVRMDFTLEEAGLLAKVRQTLPDATSADVARWLQAGQVHTRLIDGRQRIFNREPQNLFRFCPEAKQRQEAVAPKKPPAWRLPDHLAAVVAEAQRTGNVEVAPVHHRVTFRLTVPARTAGMNSGSVLKVWLPMPQEYRQQRDVKLLGTTPAHTVLAPAARDEGGKITGASQRTIYFEQNVRDPSQDQVFQAEYEFTSFAYYPRLSDVEARDLPADFPRHYLAERPPHIVFTPEVRALVAEIVGRETNPLAKARAIFHWVCANVPWCAEEEYGTIPSLCLKGLAARRGDCGVQSLAFQTLCRAAGIPTRWQSGWETKPSESSMHDWCEIYLAPWGWLPCDASYPGYGVQTSGDPAVREFYLGHQDSYRIIFNLDYGCELTPAKRTLRSEPLDLQRGEVELDGKNLYFDQWNCDCAWALGA